MRTIQPLQCGVMGIVAGMLAFGPCLHGQTPPSTDLPTVLLLATDPTALSGTSSGAFTVIRYGPETNDLVVNLTLSGTASNGVDYVTIPNTLTISNGDRAADILVSPIVNLDHRGNKKVVLTLDTNANYAISGKGRATVLIVDDVYNVPPPTVTLTDPTNGTVFNDPISITLTAEASDPLAPILSVSFFADDKFLGKTTTSPYSLVWSNPPNGKFALFARAANQVGESALSAPVSITVTDILPTVTITSPTNGQDFAQHDDITITADATDTVDAIQRVAFYVDDHKLGVSTNAPYSVLWSNAPAGMFWLRAVAVDVSGDRGYAQPVLINVSRTPKGNVRLRSE
ncbi:MAG: Ig-like domain-containing protein [Limisphaerales bacterium]